MARGWPTCLRAVAATALMVKEASKLTLGQPTTVYTPHRVQAVLETKGDRWMTGGRITQYQALLLDTPEIKLRVCQTLNPATLLPDPPTSPLDHQCIQITDELYSSRRDLSETPLSDPEENWHTDGSSFVEKGERKAGYAVASLEETKESGSLPPDTSAQKAELFALTRALELGEGKRINVCMDSKYAFLILHARAAIWKERGMLSARSSAIKHKELILRLLEAVKLPAKLAVIHCKSHQKGQEKEAQGNRKADQEAGRAAGEATSATAICPLFPKETLTPDFTPGGHSRYAERGWEIGSHGWFQPDQAQIILPDSQV